MRNQKWMGNCHGWEQTNMMWWLKVMLDSGTEKAIQGKSRWNPKGSAGPFTVASSVHVPRWDLSGLSSPVNPGVTSKQAFYVTTKTVCVVLSQGLNSTIHRGDRSPSPFSRALSVKAAHCSAGMTRLSTLLQHSTAVFYILFHCPKLSRPGRIVSVS